MNKNLFPNFGSGPQLRRLLHNLLRHVVACLLLVILVGCASSGVVRNSSPMASNAVLSRDFVLLQTSTSVPNTDDKKHLLDALIISGLQQAQKFGRVSGNANLGNPGAGMKVDVVITKVYKVS